MPRMSCTHGRTSVALVHAHRSTPLFPGCFGLGNVDGLRRPVHIFVRGEGIGVLVAILEGIPGAIGLDQIQSRAAHMQT